MPRPPATETREKLLAAGLELFARHGFEGVTTRMLAAEAGVNLAAIAYHFGGIKELYLAVTGRCVEEMEEIHGPLVERVRTGVANADGDRSELSRITRDLVEGFLAGFLGEESQRWRVALVLREYAHPGEAFDLLYEGRIRPTHEAVAVLVAAAIGGAPEDDRSIIRAHALIGQIVFFGMAWVPLWKRLSWPTYTPEHHDTIVSNVIASVLSSLDLPPVEE